MTFKVKDGILLGSNTVLDSSKNFTGRTFTSDVAVGTSPLTVTSTTMVANLNADLLDGNHASAFATSSHTHSLTIGDGTASQITYTSAETLHIVGGTNVTLTYDDTNNKVTIAASQPTVNNGTFGTTATTAGATNTDVSLSLSAAYSANSASNVTIKAVVGPALTALATVMAGATTGYLKKTGVDTYTLDTSTFLTAESDTLSSVTGRGASTATAVSLTNTTDSSSTSTGALIVSGGVGIAKKLYVGSDASVAGILSVTSNIKTTSNSASSLANGTFNTASSVIGGLHFNNGGGNDGAGNQAAITFQGDTVNVAQAGIYVHNNPGNGTHMAFATTGNYSNGPQIGLSISNTGVANFPRARPRYNGLDVIVQYDAAIVASLQLRDDTPSANVIFDTVSSTTTATTQIQLASYAIATYCTGKFLIQATQGTIKHVTEILVMHDGTTAYTTEYAVMRTGISLFTLTTDINASNLRILLTPSSATSTTFRASYQLIAA